MPSRLAVRMMRRAISPLLAINRLSSMASHAEQAETRLSRYRGIERRGKGQSQTITRLSRIDHAIVPQPRCRVIGIAFVLIFLADRRFECLRLLRRPIVGVAM